MTEDLEPVLRMTATAALAGAAGRVLLALHGGERHWLVLLIALFVGAMLGIIVAAGVLYFDPSLRQDGWPLLIVGGGSGLAGAIGTRILDMITEIMMRKLK